MHSLPTPHRRGLPLVATALIAVLVLSATIGLVRWAGREDPGPAGTAAASPEQVAARAKAGSGVATGPIDRTCDGKRTAAARELRGMWLTTVNNIDWPSRPGLPEATVKAEYRAWLDLAQRLNHNAVFVHVRPSGDAFWPSPVDPWSEWLTGKRDGKSPGWDPMEFMVAEAHARNVEFHAWFNPYRGSQPGPDGAGADPKRLAPNHPLLKHPDWAVTHPKGKTGRFYYNPGIPEARRFVEDAMLDAVTRYDIDGVHFDDFFYPYPVEGQDFPDDAAFKRYGKDFDNKDDWRRSNVNLLVEEMARRIKEVKPWVKFGISPFGIWRNKATDPEGSDSRGLQSYDAIYADTRLWVREKWLDYIVPQLYWQIGFDIADYAKLLPWWSTVIAGSGVQLYIGQADYRVGQPGAWRNPAELDRQLALNRRFKEVTGSVHFSAKQVRADRLGSVSRYQRAHYAAPALVPTMAQLPAEPPLAPSITAAKRDPTTGAITITGRPAPNSAPVGYALYRVEGDRAQLVASSRSAGEGDQVWVDRTAAPGSTPTYCVTALDRVWNEGGTSRPYQLKPA